MEGGSSSSSSADDSNAVEGRGGVPVALFVDNVETFLAGRDADTAIRGLEERLQQYKLVEVRLLAQRRDLENKLPDIQKCLQVLSQLEEHDKSGEEMKVDFELVEGMFAQASVKESKHVCLWLGANVMLEYSLEEARSLLEKNLGNATSSLKALIDDIHFLRDQINTTEVTVARVFNWDVERRRIARTMAPTPS